MARTAGFSNVHDYLVHLVTGESEEDIAARKAEHAWGRFLADASTASTGTAADEASGLSGSEDGEEEEEEACGAEPEPEPEPQLEPAERAVPAASSPARKAASRRRAKAPAPAARAAAGSRGKKKAPVAPAAAPAAQVQTPATVPRATRTSPPVDAVVSVDQTSRKARMMQRMGLTPRS
jgi:hypothetical protein